MLEGQQSALSIFLLKSELSAGSQQPFSIFTNILTVWQQRT